MKTTELQYASQLSDTDDIIVNYNGQTKRIQYSNFKGSLNEWTSISNKPFETYDATYFKSIVDGNDVLSFSFSDGIVAELGKISALSKNSHTHDNKEIIDKFTLDADGNLIWNNMSIGSDYELPVATTNTLGGVKPDGTTITIDENGVISGASTYELPKATTTNLGGIMVDGTTITVNENGVITCINEGSVIADWASNVKYPLGCVVIYETTMYKCLETHTSGDVFDSAKWQALTGEKGEKGDDGINGVSPIVITTQTETGATISVTDASGTTTSVLTNGVDGVTPHIDENSKNWFIGEEDTGVLAEGITTVITSAVVYDGTLSAENWVGDTVPYIQEVVVNGISESSRPYIYLSYSTDDTDTILEEQKQWGCITRAVTSDNLIAFYCYKDKPTIALNFEAEVR